MKDRGIKAFVGLSTIVLLLWLGFWGTVLYVAVHFIRKVW